MMSFLSIRSVIRLIQRKMFAILIFGLILGQVGGACYPGYEQLGDFCYAVLHLRASWAEAQHYCAAVGGSLAVIQDAQEEALIDDLLRRQTDPNITASQIWIGGTDLLQEGIFVEPKTLIPLTYFNWAPTEPDNLGGQHCLSIFNNVNLQWDDNKCEVHNYALCKTENES